MVCKMAQKGTALGPSTKMAGTTAAKNPKKKKTKPKPDDDYSDSDSGGHREEDPEDYCPGGYHPISPGDLLGDYLVQRKLGWGYFSTVHACQHSTNGQIAAIKVVKSRKHYREAAIDEIGILKKIDGHQGVISLVDNFEVRGVNGAHICLAFPLLGPNLLAVIDRLDDGFPIPVAKRCSREIFEALAFIHSKGIIHTDLKPENLLFEREPNYDASDPIEVFAQTGTVKLIDFGNACYTHKHFTGDIVTREYRSVEVYIEAPYSTPVDCWSAATIVFELVTGDTLFTPRSTTKFSKTEDHLAQIEELLGSHVPDSLLKIGKRTSQYYDSAGRLKAIKKLNYWPLLDVLGEKYRVPNPEAVTLNSFLLPLLDLDPNTRATAARALTSPWLSDV